MMKKKLMQISVALLMAISLVPSSTMLEAKHVGSGVYWNYGGDYWSAVWSHTNNSARRVAQVRASVYKDDVYQSSDWEKNVANASLDGRGRARAFYDYR